MGVFLVELIQTKKLIEASKLPTLLDVEQILSVRQWGYKDYYLRNLVAGTKGEEEVLEFMRCYGSDDWKAIRNIWLNFSGKFECDLLLLTNSGVEMFEIKNYNGHFVYENGDCKLNNRVLPDNPITQTKRNIRKLKSILHRIDSTIQVSGTLVFIGEHNSVEIKSSVSDIQIVSRNQFRDFIQKMAAVDDDVYYPINHQRMIKQLEHFEDMNYFVPKPLESAEMDSLRKGIYCAKCHCFDIELKKLYIHCPCGYTEIREIGILRTIYEYSVLTMKRQITYREAYDFIDGQAGNKYLIKIMKKYLKFIDKNKYSYYDIEPLPFHKNNSLH